MCLGIPGQVVAVTDPDKLLAVVDVAGVRRVVNIACIVDEAHSARDCLGNWVLVHVGFAMSRINEEEAMRTLELLREIGEVQTELTAMRTSAQR